MSHPAQRLMSELARLPAEKSSVLYDLFDSGTILQKDILGHVATSVDHLNGMCLYFRSNPQIVARLNKKAIAHEMYKDIAGFVWIAI